MIILMNLETHHYVIQFLGWSQDIVDSLNGEHKKWGVILIGPPGCGKGTQADFLAERFGLTHLESSRIIEEKFKNSNPDDPIMTREKKIWESGELNNPEMVQGWIITAINNVWQKGNGVVLSASPRTLLEAEKELPVLEKLYGAENIKVINIDLSRGESFNRNSNRRICEENRHPIPNLPEFKELTTCPRDGSKLIHRSHLDDPETVKLRYDVYLKRTKPILDFLNKKGFPIIKINGEQTIEKVFADILTQLVKLD